MLLAEKKKDVTFYFIPDPVKIQDPILLPPSNHRVCYSTKKGLTFASVCASSFFEVKPAPACLSTPTGKAELRQRPGLARYSPKDVQPRLVSDLQDGACRPPGSTMGPCCPAPLAEERRSSGHRWPSFSWSERREAKELPFGTQGVSSRNRIRI